MPSSSQQNPPLQICTSQSATLTHRLSHSHVFSHRGFKSLLLWGQACTSSSLLQFGYYCRCHCCYYYFLRVIIAGAAVVVLCLWQTNIPLHIIFHFRFLLAVLLLLLCSVGKVFELVVLFVLLQQYNDKWVQVHAIVVCGGQVVMMVGGWVFACREQSVSVAVRERLVWGGKRVTKYYYNTKIIVTANNNFIWRKTN